MAFSLYRMRRGGNIIKACRTQEVPVRAYNDSESSACSSLLSRRRAHKWGTAFAASLFFAAFTCIAQDGRPPSADGQQPPAASATVNDRLPGNSQLSAKEQPAATSQDPRKTQIADESTKLLSMAISLKAEVDKTNKDVLSINVIRKAEEIEKLAHTVKEKIKQSAGPD